MSRPPKEYMKLPGAGVSLVARTTLWQAADHLLILDRMGYTESCRRLYYADIQAWIVQLNRHRLFWGVGFLVPLLLSILWLVNSTGGMLWPSGLSTGFWLLLLVVNYFRGPTCTTRIQTRTNEQSLSPLRRLRTSEKAFRRIFPAIEAAQGVLSRETLLTYVPEEPLRIPVPAAKDAAAPTGPKASTINHMLCALLLLVDTLVGALLALFPSGALLWSHDALVVVAFLFAVVGVALQNRGVMVRGLRNWTWWAGSFLLVQGLLMIPVSIYVWLVLYGKLEELGQDSMVWIVVMILLGVLALLTCALAAAGLILLEKNRRTEPAEPPPLPRFRPPPLPGETP